MREKSAGAGGRIATAGARAKTRRKTNSPPAEAASDPDEIRLHGAVRDFTAAHPDFGFSDIEVALSTRPEQRVGADELWDRAEQALDHGALPHARIGYQLASYVRWTHGQWSDARRDSLQAERVTRSASDKTHVLGLAEAAKCLAMLEKDLSQADALAMEARARFARALHVDRLLKLERRLLGLSIRRCRPALC